MTGPYDSLMEIFKQAVLQASEGKGKERHVFNNESFEEQIMFIIARWGLSFPAGQAVKKIVEANRLQGEAKIRELLGALNYCAGEILLVKEKYRIEGLIQ